MQPTLLEGQNLKYFYFPENQGTILSQGKFSVVYLGAELISKEKVIIKKLSPALFNNEFAKMKFFIEAGFNLQHEGIAKNIDLIVVNENLFIIQEFIPGPTLKELIYNKKYLNYKYNQFFIKIIIQCLEILSFIHSKQLCHCDIKPSNIIIYSQYEELDIENPKIKLIDFGNVKKSFSNDELEQKYQTYNIQYASPEQIFGFPELIGEHTDIFSMGLIFFETIAKEPALKIGNPLTYRRLQTVIPINQHYRINDELHYIISKATVKPNLEKSEKYYYETDLKMLIIKALSQRYQNAEDFIKDLSKLL
ncbi:MAG: serine/threonine protein kinase [Bacteroidales bacterium]|jgi:serine/threonine protein kinase|nr:serine/threonine protein kinase [Bacteroidales bacterium]